MFIYTETQLDRDKELAGLINLDLSEIQSLDSKIKDVAKMSDGPKPDDLIKLYSELKFLKLNNYLKLLMSTSLHRRNKNLKKLILETKDKKCLDFGSGVGTHAIALLENYNDVSILDVKSKVMDFAIKRITLRSLCLEMVYHHDHMLPKDYFDLVICTNVIEHVADPLKELKRIHSSLKTDGCLFLEVPETIRPEAGHFEESILLWKTEGVKFVKENFKVIEECVWTKK